MGLMHCPLCMGLAVLSALRFSAHALLLWQRYRTVATPTSASSSGNRLALA